MNLKSRENPDEARIIELLNAYKIVATREKLEKEKKKYPLTKRRTFHSAAALNSSASLSTTSLSSTVQVISATSGLDATKSGLTSADKYGLLAPVYKRLTGANYGPSQAIDPLMSIEQQFKSLIQPAVTVDNFDELPSEFFNQPIALNSCKHKTYMMKQRPFFLFGFNFFSWY